MAPKHHTVPQTYLKNFANASKQVILVDRDDITRTLRVGVTKAVAEVGFYRIETEDLAREEDRATFDPESIEAALSGIEGAAAATLKKIVANGLEGFDNHDWYRLAQFIAVQTTRGNRWREDFTALVTLRARIEFLSGLTDEKVRAWLVEKGRPHAAEDIADYVEQMTTSRFPRVIPPQALLVQESLKMAIGTDDDLGLTRFLVGKTLRLVTPSTVAVLTSDEPVSWWSAGDDPVGYATAQVVWLPLTPRLVVELRDPDLDLREVGLTDDNEVATFVNGLVAAQAERWIIHHPNDKPLADVTLPPRQIWGDRLISTTDDGDERRQLWIHQRMDPREEPGESASGG